MTNETELYAAKIEQRRDRLRMRADKARQESCEALKRSDEIGKHIPFGQPILVGHHSERVHRSALEKMRNSVGKSGRLDRLAADYEEQAKRVGTRGISDDDPEALIKLREELGQVKAAQLRMKQANSLVRRNDREGLSAMGFTAEQTEQLLSGNSWGRKGYPPYELTNNGANIRRIAARIADLETLRARSPVEITTATYSYREDTDDNRISFQFTGKPSQDIRALLKASAFKWSPTRGVWVRQLSENAIWAGLSIRRVLDRTGAAASTTQETQHVQQ